jgi:hypothetical protein
MCDAWNGPVRKFDASADFPRDKFEALCRKPFGAQEASATGGKNLSLANFENV